MKPFSAPASQRVLVVVTWSLGRGKELAESGTKQPPVYSSTTFPSFSSQGLTLTFPQESPLCHHHGKDILTLRSVISLWEYVTRFLPSSCLLYLSLWGAFAELTDNLLGLTELVKCILTIHIILLITRLQSLCIFRDVFCWDCGHSLFSTKKLTFWLIN